MFGDAPLRWAALEGGTVEVAAPDRDALRTVLEAFRRLGAMVRCEGAAGDDRETWAAEGWKREGFTITTGMAMHLVAIGSAAVTTARASYEREAGRYVRVPTRIFWTGKGLERQ